MRTASSRLNLALSFIVATSLASAQDAIGDTPAKSQDPRILLRYATFDPLVNAPEVPANLQAGVDTNLWIVQFDAAPTDELRARIRAAGGVIHGYLPHDCHVVRMDAARAANVNQLPGVRWVGNYQPAYRLEAFLLAELQAGRPMPARPYNMVMADKRRDKQALEARIVGIGGKVVDRHINGLLFTAELTGAQLVAAARFDEVLYIDRWTPIGEDMNNARIQGGANTVETAGGYTGTGVRGHIYEGVEFNHPDFNTALTNVRSGGAADAHGHCTAGIVFGNGNSAPEARGMAPNAVGFYTNYNSVTAGFTRNMVIDDVVNVHSCMFTTASWGNTQTNLYTTVSADADDIVFDHRIPWTNSMSNLGNQNARPQAWAKNVISIGGVQHFNNSNAADDSWLAGNGSIGPAQDGRNKPDLASYYDSVWTSDLSGAAGYNTAAGVAGNFNTGFNGTSSATPIVAGHNALAIQMFTDFIFSNPPRVSGGTRFQNRPYAQTLKALMITGANMYTPTATDNRREHVGWGHPNVANLFNRADKFTIIPEDVPITQGATHTYQVSVLSGETTLKVCMTYLDPAGVPAAAIDRINDLTLRVISPGGTGYWGNVGLMGAAQANVSSTGGAANTVDTVECVFLNNPTAGTWTIQITAPTIAADAHLATAATDATYALVVNGGRRVYGSGCARYIPDTSTTGTVNVIPFGTTSAVQLPTIYAQNNQGSVGGTVFFDLTVTDPLYLTGLGLNTTAAVGADLLLDVYRTAGGNTHVGNELNPAVWIPMTAGRGVAAGVDVASIVDFSQPFFLPAGTYGIAVVAGNFAHHYTNGTGGNQNYSNADLAMVCGSATNGAFGPPSVFTPRVANMTLRYQTDNGSWTNQRYQTIIRREELGAAGSISGLAFSADSTGRHWNESLLIRMSHVPAGHTMVSTFATNLPAPVTVLNASNYSFDTVADNWREIGLQTAFAYNGTSDVVVDIVARGNHHTAPSGFNRGTEPRVQDAGWTGATPATGFVDNAAQRMRVSFNCASANEHGSSCGMLRASHVGDGHRGATFTFRVNDATPNFLAVLSLGLINGAPLPLSLSFLGWTNCLAFNDSVVAPTVPTDASGIGNYGLAIPNNAALDGAIVYGQWFTIDTSEPGDITFSNQTRVIVGLTP